MVSEKGVELKGVVGLVCVKDLEMQAVERGSAIFIF
jgi:hypothetical protein